MFFLVGGNLFLDLFDRVFSGLRTIASAASGGENFDAGTTGQDQSAEWADQAKESDGDEKEAIFLKWNEGHCPRENRVRNIQVRFPDIFGNESVHRMGGRILGVLAVEHAQGFQ